MSQVPTVCLISATNNHTDGQTATSGNNQKKKKSKEVAQLTNQDDSWGPLSQGFSKIYSKVIVWWEFGLEFLRETATGNLSQSLIGTNH